jgi:hypothetical protein
LVIYKHFTPSEFLIAKTTRLGSERQVHNLDFTMFESVLPILIIEAVCSDLPVPDGACSFLSSICLSGCATIGKRLCLLKTFNSFGVFDRGNDKIGFQNANAQRWFYFTLLISIIER